MTSQPDIVRDGTKCGVPKIGRQDRTKPVFEVVPTARLESDSIEVEPCAPERPAEKVDMTIDEATRVVPERRVGLGLDVKVDDSQNPIRGEKRA